MINLIASKLNKFEFREFVSIFFRHYPIGSASYTVHTFHLKFQHDFIGEGKFAHNMNNFGPFTQNDIYILVT
jgi:hypothetical protein